MAHCVNCQMLLRSNFMRYRSSEVGIEISSILQQWIQRETTELDSICEECFNLLIVALGNDDGASVRQFGHQRVCACCGISVLRRRNAQLLVEGPERNRIAERIFPREVLGDAYLCYCCWVDTRRDLQRNSNEIDISDVNEIPAETSNVPNLNEGSSIFSHPSSESEEPSSSLTIPTSIDTTSITMPNHRRTADTPNHCFVHGCENVERLRITEHLRVRLLVEHKLYVTENARVCHEHCRRYDWDFFESDQYSNNFSASILSEMLDLLSRRSETKELQIDFENVEEMSGILCHYWTGLSTESFLNIIDNVPMLSQTCRKPKTALGMYLLKMRTGDSNQRIASLFGMCDRSVGNYLKMARDSLSQQFVPRHIGLDHIPRENLSERNLVLPQGLFGNLINSPIIICDGTYVYVQKSSNYAFQKDTYSVHKFANLVKPFLIVATDGHIVDVVGPYKATVSDATIMRELFGSEDSDFRRYFREGDIFILDRGFRDAIPLLESLNYAVHKPESLDDHEIQLSTEKANKSRCVTMCRWVVEVVNGRFKRDYKMFRSEYFNCAASHLMDDFKVAAAIINAYHPCIVDRPDAQLFLEKALERLHVQNHLSEYVISNNLNRRTSQFHRIDGDLPHLQSFPQLTMSQLELFALGTYQIKQARSYYGEHIKQNGTFVIEVAEVLDRVNSGTSNEATLIRGKIKSRHRSGKVYNTYITLRGELNEISEYYCTCVSGKRTVGCCSHVMTIVWYLGWARHQEHTLPPASFLDNIFVI